MNKHNHPAVTMSLMSLPIFQINFILTAMYLALSPMGHALHLAMIQLPWVVMSYMLFFAGTITFSGRLGDIHGHIKVSTAGFIIFGLAALLAGLSSSFSLILLALAGMGIGAGLMWPNTTTLAFGAMSKENRGLAIGIISGVIGLALAAGPLVGGILIHYLSWRSIFLVNVPISALISVLVPIIVKKDHQKPNETIDYLGAFLLVIVLAALTLGFNQIPAAASLHHDVIGIFVVALIALIVFIFQQGKTKQTILPKELIKNSEFIMSCVLRFFTAMPLYIVLLIGGLFLQQNMHINAMQAGLAFLPMTLAIGILSPVGGRLVDRFSAKHALAIATLFYIAAFVLLSSFVSIMHAILFSMLLIPVGIAFALASPGALAMSLGAAPERLKAAATAIFYMVSLVSGLVGSALTNAILQHYSTTSVNPHALLIIFIIAGVLGVVSLLLSTSKTKSILSSRI